MHDAFIYIPGLSGMGFDQSVDCVSRKLITAFEHQSKDSQLEFELREADSAEYESGRTVIRDVYAKHGNEDCRQLRVYELSYSDTLTRDLQRRSQIAKIISLLWLLLTFLPRFMVSLRRKGKTAREKMQILWVAALLAVVGLYTILLINSAVVGIIGATNSFTGAQASLESWSQEGASGSGDSEIVKSLSARWFNYSTYLSYVVLILTGLGVVLPKNLRETFDQAAIKYACVAEYLGIGGQQDAISGQLADLIDYIRENDQECRKVYLITYSFGTLVALNALYPRGTRAARMDDVDGLVTIGCPFDMVRVYFTDYFKRRQGSKAHPERWINIYSPRDVLGSNFRDDDADHGEAEWGLGLQGDEDLRKPDSSLSFTRGGGSNQLGFLELLLFAGLRAHTSYWNPDEPQEISCFHEIVSKLYQGRLPSPIASA